MEAIFSLLLSMWDVVVNWGPEHPITALILGTVSGYLGVRGLSIAYFILYMLKALHDRLVDDTEMAFIGWRLTGIICDWLPGVSSKAILNYAPEHWHAIILNNEGPTFKLIAVPQHLLLTVQGIIEGDRATQKTQPLSDRG